MTRWVYDGCGDPVYVRALATAILSGGTQAEIDVVTDTGRKRLEATHASVGEWLLARLLFAPIASLSFSNEGTTTVISAGQLELTVVRVIDPARQEEVHGRHARDSWGRGPPMMRRRCWHLARTG